MNISSFNCVMLSLLSLLFQFGSVSALVLARDQYTREAPGLAPLHGYGHPGSIKDTYIVHFKRGLTLEDHIASTGINVTALPGFYDLDFIPGYAATLDETTLHESVRRDDGVLLVEADYAPELIDSVDHERDDDAPPSNLTLNKRTYKFFPRKNAEWNQHMLTSMDKLKTPVQPGANDFKALYNENRYVHVFVLDTGVRVTHNAFEGTAYNIFGLESGRKSPYCDEALYDFKGHGTHVAGIVSNPNMYGVADAAHVINVKVLGKGAANGKMARAINDIRELHNTNKKNKPAGWRGSVINMSFKTPPSKAFGDALAAARKDGVTLFAAAGNDNRDSWKDSVYPCCYSSVACLGAIDNKYNKASFSNYGSCIDYVAPGVQIRSASNESDTATALKSGTSMASPHAAGAAAIFTSWKGLANGQAYYYLKQNSRSGQVGGFGWFSGTSTLLINTGINLYWKNRGEPFRYSGQDPRGGIKTNNFFEKDASPPSTALGEAIAVPKDGVVDALPVGDGDGALEEMPAVDDVFEAVSTDVTKQTILPLSFNVLWYEDADTLKDSGCGGVFGGQHGQQGDKSPCVRPDRTATCVQAVVINGTAPCRVSVYEDTECKKAITLPGMSAGLFGQGQWDQEFEAVTGPFNSLQVDCTSK